MTLNTSSLADPMPTILDTLAGVNAIRKAEADNTLAPSPDRAAFVDLLEKHADWHDGQAWIRVETAADLFIDLPNRKEQ